GDLAVDLARDGAQRLAAALPPVLRVLLGPAGLGGEQLELGGDLRDQFAGLRVDRDRAGSAGADVEADERAHSAPHHGILRRRVLLPVTLNLALDVTYCLDSAPRLGEVNRVTRVAARAGGKGVNVAR